MNSHHPQAYTGTKESINAQIYPVLELVQAIKSISNHVDGSLRGRCSSFLWAPESTLAQFITADYWAAP
jgi:hypothetical protein